MNVMPAIWIALAWYQALAMFRAIAAGEQGWSLFSALLSAVLLGWGLAHA